MATTQAELDPITLSVMGRGVQGHRESRWPRWLYRMSYSSIIRESEDPRLRDLLRPTAPSCAESDTTPMHVGSIPGYLEGIISVVGDDIHDGGRLPSTNDPYLGASHTPDLCIAIPIFHDGKLCAWGLRQRPRGRCGRHVPRA